MTSVTSPPILYRRFTEQGTLSEPKGVPAPRFAFQATVNWMPALAILCGRRIGRSPWNDFLADLTAHCPLSVKPDTLWTTVGRVP